MAYKKTLAIVCCMFFNFHAIANFEIIRDTEIEETLTDIAKEIFKVAELNDKSAHVYVVNSDTINAFTIGNGYIFVTSAFLLKFQNPIHAIGVFCHETAHIAANHINRQMKVFEQRSNTGIAALLATAVGAMVSPAAVALMLGYIASDTMLSLRFSREEEMSADCLAAKYLNKLGYSTNAMIDVLNEFEKMELLNGFEKLPVYIRSHPKSSARISALRTHSNYNSNKNVNHELLNKYSRVLIKLKAHLKHNDIYISPSSDLYSQAIFYYNNGNMDKSISILRELISKNQSDIYYKETLAKTLLESRHIQESIDMYKEILKQCNNKMLIKVDYALALIASNQPSNIDLAIKLLTSAKYEEEFDPGIFKALGDAYAKKKDFGVADYMYAREQFLMQDYESALHLINRAIGKLTNSKFMHAAKYYQSIIKEANTKLGLIN